MDDDAKPTITVRSPQELVQAVPYLLGYHPRDQVVAVGLTETQVAVVSAVALAQARFHGFNSGIRPLRTTGAAQVLLVGYGHAEEVTPAMDRCRADLTQAGLPLTEALRVADGRMWSYTCTSPECCPPEGTAVDMSASPVAVSLTVQGAAPAASRDDVAQLLAPVSGAERAAMDLATTQAGARLAARFGPALADGSIEAVFTDAGQAVVDKIMGSQDLPGVDDIAELGYFLIAPGLVDEVIRRIDAGYTRQWLPLWIWVTRHLQPDYRWLAANVTAFAAWRSGNGVLAAAAVRVSLDDQPDEAINRIGYLMAAILAQAIPPDGIPPITSIHDIDTPTPAKSRPVEPDDADPSHPAD